MTILLERILNVLRFFHQISDLFLITIKTTFTKPFLWYEFKDQIYRLGNKSLALVILTSLAVGAVMTLQYGWGLNKFGGKLFIPKVIALSMTLELAPVFTALILAGRVGSGIASQLGSMNVTQQIDAIQALGTDPIQRLVVPRFWAMVVSTPLLTTISIILGIYSGMMIGAHELNISGDFFVSKAFSGITLKELTIGLGKTFFFGMFISLTACYKGLKTRGGTTGVGDATTWTVVVATSFVLIGDVFLTKLLMILVGK